MTIKTGHPLEVEVEHILSNVKVYARLGQLRYVTAKSVSADDQEANKVYTEDAEERLIKIERGIYAVMDEEFKRGALG